MLSRKVALLRCGEWMADQNKIMNWRNGPRGGEVGKTVVARVRIGWVALEVEFSVFLGGKRVTLR